MNAFWVIPLLVAAVLIILGDMCSKSWGEFYAAALLLIAVSAGMAFMAVWYMFFGRL